MTSDRSTPPEPPEDRVAAELRGFGPLGILAILVILAGALVAALLGALLVLAWVAWSRTPWREIGYARPTNWVRTVAVGIVVGFGLKLLLKAIVLPLLGADPINPAYHYLVGNVAALPVTLFSFIVGAGFGEETLYRAYLFERLGKLFGSTLGAKAFIAVFTAALFSLAHYSVQGLAGSEQALVTGLVFGTIYAITGQIWIPMIAHVAYDLTALAIIFWNLEPNVAHLIFK